MEKIANFRDLGGLKTADGRRIKKGCFYRSTMLDEATDADIAEVNALGIKHIVDYRDANEGIGNRDVYVNINAEHHKMPAGVTSEKLLKLVKTRSVRALFDKFVPEDVYPVYRKLPFNNAGYATMFRLVAAKESPIWQHCSAGKDRAGVGCALLEKMLGVTDEEIMSDYMASLASQKVFRQIVKKILPPVIKGFILRQIKPLLIVMPEFLEQAFKAVHDKYGSFERYFEEEYGLTAAKIKELRDYYLE